MWLKCPVAQPDAEAVEGVRESVATGGRRQGVVISPLVSNLFLHWFDVVFHREDGPAYWATAKLVRYADDFVVLVLLTLFYSTEIRG